VKPLLLPEEDRSAAKHRRRPNWIFVPGTTATRAYLGEDEGPLTRERVARMVVAIVICVAVLLIVGVILARLGPLPRISPLLN